MNEIYYEAVVYVEDEEQASIFSRDLSRVRTEALNYWSQYQTEGHCLVEIRKTEVIESWEANDSGRD